MVNCPLSGTAGMAFNSEHGLLDTNSTKTKMSKTALATLRLEEINRIIYRVGICMSILLAVPTLFLIARVYKKSRKVPDVSRMMALMFGVLFCDTVYHLQTMLLGDIISREGDKQGSFYPTEWCTLQAFITQNTLIPSCFLLASFTCEINNVLVTTGSSRASARSENAMGRLREYLLLSFVPSSVISVFYVIFGKFGPSRKWYVKDPKTEKVIKNRTDFSMCWVDVGDVVSIFFSYFPLLSGLVLNAYFLANIGKHLIRASGQNAKAREHFNSVFLKMTYLPSFTFCCYIPGVFYLIFTAIANSGNSRVNSSQTDRLWYEPTMSYLVSGSLSVISFVQSIVILLTNARVRKEARLLSRWCTGFRQRRLSLLQDTALNNSQRPLMCDNLIATDDEDDSEFEGDGQFDVTVNRSKSSGGTFGSKLLEESGRSKSEDTRLTETVYRTL